MFYIIITIISPTRLNGKIYLQLEFQGPKNSSSCGELARFAYKNVRFAHKNVRFAYNHLFINNIIGTTASNKKCLSPP